MAALRPGDRRAHRQLAVGVVRHVDLGLRHEPAEVPLRIGLGPDRAGDQRADVVLGARPAMAQPALV